MSSEPLIGPLMVDVPGLELTPEDREILNHPLVGGVILFTRNYRDPEQIARLCQQIAGVRGDGRRLLLAVDHEGGRIQRFRVGFSRIPSMGSLGRRLQENAVEARRETYQAGLTIAKELGGLGIDLCFAPVLDLDFGVSEVIGDRAFSPEPDVVIELARIFRQGLNDGGMAATGKHFPGHGSVVADSHKELPIDRRDRHEIESLDLVPFRTLVADGIESLMMAHVRYPAVDDLPASLSQRWIGEILRGELGFDRAIFCDDLSMHGAAVVGDLEARCRQALLAGCDMLPVCNDRPGVITLLDGLRDLAPDPVASQRLHPLYLSSTPR